MIKNREIKFRIWHEQDKCFIYSEPFDPNIVGGGGYTKNKSYYYHFWPDANIGGELCQIKSCCLTNRPIHQYTGLKDKNNVEIYEGDIVKTASAHMFRDNIFIVEYLQNRFVPDDIYDGKDVEVIGNVFENKELIK